jgi:hypothetical protein
MLFSYCKSDALVPTQGIFFAVTQVLLLAWHGVMVVGQLVWLVVGVTCKVFPGLKAGWRLNADYGKCCNRECQYREAMKRSSFGTWFKWAV